jgi:hypothetical protein
MTGFANPHQTSAYITEGYDERQLEVHVVVTRRVVGCARRGALPGTSKRRDAAARELLAAAPLPDPLAGDRVGEPAV